MERMQNTPPGTAGPPGRAAAQPGAPRSPHLQVPLSPRAGTSISPPGSRGAGEPAPPALGGGCRCGRGRWNCPFRGCNIGAHRPEQFPGWELLSPVWGGSGGERRAVWGSSCPSRRRAPRSHPLFFPAHPKPHSHPPAPAWPPFPPSPILCSSSPGVFTSSPGRRHVSPPPHPQPPGNGAPLSRAGSAAPPGVPRLPGHPHPRPGCPFPGAGRNRSLYSPPACCCCSSESGDRL